MNPIPIAKPLVGAEEAARVQQVLASGMLASGPVVGEFERSFASYVGARHAIATSNGTTALHAALVGLGIRPGDEVIVPAFTFIASANSVLLAGATPVLVDVDERTFCVDPAAIEAAITPRTRAIMPVHLFGHPADMDAMQAIAAQNELRVLGDAAQAHGAALGSRRVGALGDAECFSFYPTKNMTTGEGGMVTTNDDTVAARVRAFVNHGRADAGLGTYDHLTLGHNFRLTDLHAAIGTVQLGKLESWNARRRSNAEQLSKLLGGADVVLPSVAAGARHAFHQYTVRTRDRAALIHRLRADGVGFGVYYPKALHQYAHLAAYARGPLPRAESAAREVLSLPVHPAVSDADIERVAAAVQRA